MSAKYCLCGGKTEYTIKPPIYCCVCSKSFNKTFGSDVAEVAPQPIKTSSAGKTNKSRMKENNNDEDYYNKDEIQDLASEIANSMSAKDFGLIVPRAEKRGYSLSEILDPKNDIIVGQRGPIDQSS